LVEDGEAVANAETEVPAEEVIATEETPAVADEGTVEIDDDEAAIIDAAETANPEATPAMPEELITLSLTQEQLAEILNMKGLTE
jgi:hypothetical protein